MRNAIMSEDDMSLILVVTGPMSNIAAMLTTFPEVKRKIKCIVSMGGAIGIGNVSPAAEFNFFVDPIAAKIVFSQGIPIVIMPLDLTHTVLITDDILLKLLNIDNNLSHKLYQIFSSLKER